MSVTKVRKGPKEFITKVWKDPKKGKYVAINQEVMKVRDEEIKIDFHFIGNNGKEEHLELLGEYRNLGPPLCLGLCSSNPITYENGEKLLELLSASGVKPKEIEKLRAKL